MSRSEELHEQAKRVIPGGVNSPVRAFRAVGGTPLYVASGRGSRICDADGREYIDCVCSWGPLILGHAHPHVIAAIEAAAKTGTSFGAPTERELRLATRIVELVPGIEKVRLVNSGTEATMSAVRLARAATERDKIVKFAGCYHGHADSFLIKAGSGALTFRLRHGSGGAPVAASAFAGAGAASAFAGAGAASAEDSAEALGQPSSPGVPRLVAADTLVATFNDLDSVRRLFEANPGAIACVIVEPVAGNMGVVPPEDGFLAGLRELTAEHGALLIFDEVITGFRLAPGGAQERYGVTPDLTTLGKIIGGGLPVGAFGGRADLMDRMAPEGPVYQAGTLSGNPLAVAAGLATLEVLEAENPYARLDALTEKLCRGLVDAACAAGGDAARAPRADAVGGSSGGAIGRAACAPGADAAGGSSGGTDGRAACAPGVDAAGGSGGAIGRAACALGVDVVVNRVGSMGCAFFTRGPVRNDREAAASDTRRFAAFHRGMLERGVYLAPSQFEAFFVSAAHSEADIEAIIAAARGSLAGLGTTE